MALVTIKKRQKKSVTDEVLLAAFFECDENKSQTAKKLNIERSTVQKRMKEMKPELLEAARASFDGGGIAVTVASSVQEVREVGFIAGATRRIGLYDTFGALNSCFDRVNKMTERLDAELDAHHANPRSKIKPYHVNMLSQLNRELRGTIDSTHKIKKDLFSIEETMRFYEAVVRVMEEESPDVQSRIYRKLSALNANGGYTVIYPEATGEETPD